MTPEYLNSLIAAYTDGAGVYPPLTWVVPLAWQPWPKRTCWLTAPIPPEVGTIGAHELGRAFKRAGLDYRMDGVGGRATAIHVGSKEAR